MAEAVFIFIAGIVGVFIGMAMLYIAIKIVSLVTSRLKVGEGKNDG